MTDLLTYSCWWLNRSVGVVGHMMIGHTCHLRILHLQLGAWYFEFPDRHRDREFPDRGTFGGLWFQRPAVFLDCGEVRHSHAAAHAMARMHMAAVAYAVRFRRHQARPADSDSARPTGPAHIQRPRPCCVEARAALGCFLGACRARGPSSLA